MKRKRSNLNDRYNRKRNRMMAFRVSEEEFKQIHDYVSLSGLNVQDYLTSRMLCRDIVVQGNPRVFKALRDRMDEILTELRRIASGTTPEPEMLETIGMIAEIMEGLKKERGTI